MSLVVAEKHDRIWMGADTSVSCGDNYTRQPDEKLFKFGRRFVVGCVGTLRIVQVFRELFEPPKHPASLTTIQYFHKKFIPEFHALMEKWGFVKRDDDKIPTVEIMTLIGYQGKLYLVDFDFTIRPIDDYWAIGVGDTEARSFLKYCNIANPRERIAGAIAAGKESNWGISEEIQILTL